MWGRIKDWFPFIRVPHCYQLIFSSSYLRMIHKTTWKQKSTTVSGSIYWTCKDSPCGQMPSCMYRLLSMCHSCFKQVKISKLNLFSTFHAFGQMQKLLWFISFSMKCIRSQLTWLVSNSRGTIQASAVGKSCAGISKTLGNFGLD